MHWQAADGRVLEGWVGGHPDGPLVAVLHGWPDTRHVAMTGDAAAREVGVRLLCVNRPGAGFGEVEVVVRPRTSHLATLVAHRPEVLRALRQP